MAGWEEAGGVGAQEGDDLAEGHAVFAVEDAEGEGEGGFEAGDAVGGALELDLFLVA